MILRSGVDDTTLPSVPRSVVRSMRLAYRSEPRLLLVAFVLVAGGWVPEALGALWLKHLAEGAIAGDAATVRWAVAGLAAAAAGGWLLRVLGERVEMRFRDLATIEIEAHVAHLQGSIAGIEHHERPDLLDRLQLLRDQVFLLNHIYAALMDFVGSGGRILVAVALLVSIHPALAGLAVFAVPPVVASARRAAAERAAQEAAGTDDRLAAHLFQLGTEAGPAKELRIGNAERWLVERRRAAWDRWFRTTSRARWTTAAVMAASWSLFGAAYVGAVVWVATGLDRGVGDVLLALAAGAGLSRFVANTAGQTEFLRWTIDAAQRLVWLEDFAEERAGRAQAPAPESLDKGISLHQVTFAYPGTDRLALDNITLDLPAGSVVALVGENGAGKTTLVKLLLGLYRPSAGSVSVDGTDLALISPAAWRARTAGAFQDFFKFEYTAQRTIGVGDLDRLDEAAAAEAGAQRAGAGDVLARLPAGLDTQLGPTWRGGVELSIGQWQKLALARGLLRDRPLLCVLDEPTASLDAETEHGLFERYAAASRAGADDGRITLLVSHRFSTVRMADLIVVMDGARVVEHGTHDELVARGGLYAELYEIQARSYR